MSTRLGVDLYLAAGCHTGTIAVLSADLEHELPAEPCQLTVLAF